MRKIDLDGRLLQRNEEGYYYLKQAFLFPDYYGKNLDALYDLLTEIGTEVEIHVNNSGDMDPMIKKVLLNAISDNECLKICLTK